MHFREDSLDKFQEIFEAARPLIQAFSGCQSVELLKDLSNPSIRFTYSLWNSESDLENYRNSELFKTTWAKTKLLFAEKPMAWSVIETNQG